MFRASIMSPCQIAFLYKRADVHIFLLYKETGDLLITKRKSNVYFLEPVTSVYHTIEE